MFPFGFLLSHNQSRDINHVTNPMPYSNMIHVTPSSATSAWTQHYRLEKGEESITRRLFRCTKVSEGLEHEMIYWLAHILLGCRNPSDTQERPHLMRMRALALLLIVPQDSEEQTERRDDIPQSGSMATLFHCMQISISREAHNQFSVHSSE